jgi:hypothetical protein
MDKRDPHFPTPRDEDGAAAMTGATGNLTPDDADDEFVPAETREMTDATAAHDVTAAAHRRREARNADRSDEPGRLREREDRTAPNDRDGGYGSERGLAGDDPAYREETHLPPAAPPERDRPTRIGGDEVRSPEDEHF